MHTRRVVVLGATGRLGSLVAAELAGQRLVLLVGRDRLALEALGREHGHEAALAGLDGLAGVLVPGDVLLSCVGPYDAVGDEVVRAAIRCGVTYADVTGEPAFLRRLYGPLGEEAVAAGTTLLPAVGYEYLPGHLVAELALREAGPAAHALEIAYLADGGLDAASASGRRSLVRALTRPTTTFRDGALEEEPVGARLSRFTAGGRRRPTVSLGGAEVWTIPRRHPNLATVDVHTGWFGPLGPAVAAGARLGGLARRVALDKVADALVRGAGDGRASGLAEGSSRFVARVRGQNGGVVAEREAAGGNPIVLAARLAAGVVQRLAEADLRDLPTGATDPVAVFGLDELETLAHLSGLVVL